MAILILLSIGAVSAADNATADAVSATNQEVLSADPLNFNQLQDIINVHTGTDPLILEDNYTYSGAEGEPKVVTITNPITIEGSPGKNITLNANNIAEVGIFKVDTNGVVLNNINFIKATNHAVIVNGERCVINNSHFYNNVYNSGDMHGNGPAVYWNGNDGTIDNSVFENNQITKRGSNHYDSGGAVCWLADNGVIKNSNFTNNAAFNGGAIIWGRTGGEDGCPLVKPKNGTIDNCIFTGNYVDKSPGASGNTYWAGAVQWFGPDGTIKYSLFDHNRGGWTGAIKVDNYAVNMKIFDCNFTFNEAYDLNEGSAGAVEMMADNGTIYDCNFINNTAETAAGALKMNDGATNSRVYNCNFTNNTAKHTFHGGAIEWLADNCNLTDSNFINNSAPDAGAIQWSGNDGMVLNCNFTINFVTANEGGAIRWDGKNGKVLNSNFTQNRAENEGGAIRWNGESGNVSYSNFAKNRAENEGGAIRWDGEFGNVSYSNFTENSAYYGGAISWKGNNGDLSNSIFIKNTATEEGGAVFYWYDYIWYSEDPVENATMSNCNFTDNSAGYGGGAISWNGDNGTFSNSNFINNTAENGGAIGSWGSDLNITDNCNFTSNNATDCGGAIFIGDDGSDNYVSDNYFLKNNAPSGGAVYWNAESGSLTDSYFIGNDATEEGGAVYWNGEFGTLRGSDFKDNSAKKGGAVYWQGESGSLTDSNFTSNNATENGGAVYWNGSPGTLSSSNFTDNKATENGGAIYINFNGDYVKCKIDGSNFTSNSAKQGGAVYLLSNNPISRSTFTGNKATEKGGAIYNCDDGSEITESNFTSNTANDGGAVYCGADWNGYIYGSTTIKLANFINNTAKQNGGAIYYLAESQTLVNANFTGNTAVLGGAIFADANYVSIDVAYFNNNNATNGSAIYKTAKASDFEISNTLFERNQAHSKEITIDIEGNKTYALADVTVKISLVANDNIANAIWNDGGLNTIVLKNIQCEFSLDSQGRQLKQFNEGNYYAPTGDSYDGDDKLWQNPLEDAQLIDIIIKNQNNIPIYTITNGRIEKNSKNGVLRALPNERDLTVTKTDGSITIEFNGLEAGTYTVDAVHEEDRYYKMVDSVSNFVIYDVALNVTKTPDIDVTGNDSLVNFTIVVNNTDSIGNATEVNVTDLLPDTLIFEKCGVIDNNGARITNRTLSGNHGVEWTISNITAGKSVSLWIQVRTNGTGDLTNNVTVTCKENSTKVNASANVTVIPVVLQINKTANVTEAANTNLVNFTITVNNTNVNNKGINATDVIVVDELPEGLKFVNAGVITQGVQYTKENGTLNGKDYVKWNIAEMTKNSIVELWVTAVINFNPDKKTNVTNNVNVTCKENSTEIKNSTNVTVIPVKLAIEKIANVTKVANNTLVNYTIVVNNTSEINVTDVIVDDLLPSQLTLVECGIIDADGQKVTISNGVPVAVNLGQYSADVEVNVGSPTDDGTYLTWMISKMTNNSSVKLWITALVNTTVMGKVPNTANVSCKENKTLIDDTAEIEVVPVILNITKTVDVSPVANNTVVNFTVVVGNDNIGNATDLIVIDELPIGLTFVAGGVKLDPNNVVTYLGQYNNGAKWNISRLNSKETVELWITARVNVTQAKTLTNKVNVTSKENTTEVKDTTDVKVELVVLQINKTANVTVIGNNSLVKYTITVKNNSTLDATNLTICDVLPEELIFENDASQGYSYNTSTRVISWNLTRLDAGAIHKYYVVVRTNGTGKIINNVNVACAENKTEVKNTTNITVEPVKLTIVKTTNLTANANVTDLIKFIITVTNNGPANATNVVISDEIMSVFTIKEVGNGGHQEGNKVTWTIPYLAKDNTTSVYVIVNATVNGIYKNVAVASCDENKTNVTSEIPVIVEPAVAFEIIKVANPSKVNVSDNVTFTITITNLGPSNATNVNITDVLDDAFRFDGKSTNLTCNFVGKTIVWNIGNLANGSSFSVCFNVTVLRDGILHNVATVNSTENTTGASNKTNVTALPVVDLKVNKTVDKTNVSVGDEVTYTITVTNLGPSNATDVNVTDIMTGNVKITGVDTNNVGKFNENEGVWYIGNLNKDEIFKLTITVKTLAVGIVENVVSVNSTEKDNDTSNNEYPCENVTVNPYPSLVNGENVTYIYGQPILVDYNSTNSTGVYYEIYDEDGKFVTNGTVGLNGTIEVEQLAVGNYTVYWNNTVDANHTPANNISTIEILPAPSLVNGNNVTVTYGEPIEVPYNSTNATKVSYEIFDEWGNSTGITGTVGPNGTIPVDQLPVGNYTVKWNNTVDGNHTPANNVSSITVLPAPSLVNGTNVTVTYGEPIVVPYESTNATNVTYEIFDKDGNCIVNGTVGPNGTIPVDQLPVGNYTVNWTNIVDGNHTPATNTSSITVNPAPSLVEGVNVTVYYGDPINVNYTSTNATQVTYEIYDKNGTLVANGTVGPSGIVPVDQLPVGNYTVNWTTIVDDNHIPATNTSAIEVLPMPTKVTIGNITTYPGENITIPINVITINDEPFNGTVAVVMPDNSTQNVTVVNGTGVITWYVPDDYTPDKYPDSIKFPGNEQYLPSEGTGVVEVIQIPTHVSVGNVTTFAGMEVTIPINVTADDGKPFNGNVTITFPDGSKKTVEIINGTGTTTWFVPYDYTPDKYPDNVKFDGDNKYLPSEGNGTITVIKIPVDIIVGNVTGRPGDDVVIPIKVIPREGPAFNGKVTVVLPDGTVKVIEIINGKGKVPWTIPKDYKPGKYPVRVYSDETNIYYPANGTGYVTVIVDEPPVDDGNKTHNPTSKDIPKNSLARHETGNPILVLIAVLSLLGVSIKRRK